MENIDRLLEMDLPTGQSAFLWGARKAGKADIMPWRHFLDELWDGNIIR